MRLDEGGEVRLVDKPLHGRDEGLRGARELRIISCRACLLIVRMKPINNFEEIQSSRFYL